MIDLRNIGIEKPKPQMLILINNSAVGEFKNQAIVFLKKELSCLFPKYRIDIMTSNSLYNNDFLVKIFNAHVLYEVVSYQNSEIIYPKIQKKLEDFLNDFFGNQKSYYQNTNVSEEDIFNIQASNVRSEQILQMSDMIKTLENLKRNASSKSFHLSVGEKLHILVKDYNGDVVLACEDNASLSEILEVLSGLETIEAESLKEAETTFNSIRFNRNSQFLSIDFNSYPFSYFSENQAVLTLIKEIKDNLKQNISNPDKFPLLEELFLKSYAKNFHKAIYDHVLVSG